MPRISLHSPGYPDGEGPGYYIRTHGMRKRGQDAATRLPCIQNNKADNEIGEDLPLIVSRSLSTKGFNR